MYIIIYTVYLCIYIYMRRKTCFYIDLHYWKFLMFFLKPNLGDINQKENLGNMLDC